MLLTGDSQSAQTDAAEARGISVNDLSGEVMHEILREHPTPVWLAVLFAALWSAPRCCSSPRSARPSASPATRSTRSR